MLNNKTIIFSKKIIVLSYASCTLYPLPVYISLYFRGCDKGMWLTSHRIVYIVVPFKTADSDILIFFFF